MISIILMGCHSYVLDDAQFDLRHSFTEADYQHSEELLKKFKKKNIYRSKDQVLYNLESGMIYHFSNKFDSSSYYFTNSENEIDQNYTKSVSRGIGAFLTNDNKLVYDGEPYEDLYLNAFKALNFMHLQDWEAALVETRRMTYKMEQLDIKIKGLASAFAKSDSSGKADWKTDDINIQNSALAHYLSTILYAKAGDFDDARIEREKLEIALKEQSTLTPYRNSNTSNFEILQKPSSYNVLLAGFTGRAPYKVQEDARVFIDDYDDEKDNEFYLKFSFPVINTFQSNVRYVRAVINDSVKTTLDLIENMDKVSAEVYKAKQPIIYSRALLRASTKAAGTKLISGAVREKNEFLGDLLQILGFIAQETTEKADLRSWQTMPGQAWMKTLYVPEGNNTIRIEYVGINGRVLYFDEFEVIISPNTELELVESIYVN
ncbi:MAG TPA: hypothetical protein DCX27_14770 [Balneola sp.]|nr:hypothetical protein [Balneola sp.]